MSKGTTSAKALAFNDAELVLINNALNEILHGPAAIPAWEFQTRTGVSVEEAELLLSRVGKALEASHAH